MRKVFKIKWQYFAVLLLGLVAGAYLTLSWPAKQAGAKVVTLVGRGGLSFNVESRAEDVGGLLSEQGLASEGIYSDLAPDTPLQNGLKVFYRTPVTIKVADGGERRVITSSAQIVADALAENGITLAPRDELVPSGQTEIFSGMEISIRRITEAEETRSEEIPFNSLEQGDPQMPYGSQNIVQAGQVGRQEVAYLVQYRDGKEVFRKKLSSRVISEPVDQIVKLGRKVEVESYEEGIASWYAYKKCLCAAHPYYPKGSWLRVTNLSNGKSVIVQVNDWGPDQSVNMNRIVDLDAEAFKQLAPLSLGTIEVKVEKLESE